MLLLQVLDPANIDWRYPSYSDDDPEDADDADGGGIDSNGADPQPMIIAERTAPVRTLTVSMAVLELEVSNYPVLLFRNPAHGGLAVVYRRPDGNIGWIDPERTAHDRPAEPATARDGASA